MFKLMMMTWGPLRRALLAVFALGLGIVMATVAGSVTAMPAVAKHMHGDKASKEQHPNPVF